MDRRLSGSLTPVAFFQIPEIQSKGFFGCLGQVAIDGQQIGLWNYKTSEGCAGCAAGYTKPFCRSKDPLQNFDLSSQ